ncbi:hypothetical protein V8E55_009448 [Tylopilus felleus]
MRDLTLVGLVALRDPPREDVQAAITTIRRAGVRVFMVTHCLAGYFNATRHHLWRRCHPASWA